MSIVGYSGDYRPIVGSGCFVFIGISYRICLIAFSGDAKGWSNSFHAIEQTANF